MFMFEISRWKSELSHGCTADGRVWGGAVGAVDAVDAEPTRRFSDAKAKTAEGFRGWPPQVSVEATGQLWAWTLVDSGRLGTCAWSHWSQSTQSRAANATRSLGWAIRDLVS